MLTRLLKKPQDVLIRPLTTDDQDALNAMIATSPVAFLYAAEQLDRLGLPNPSTLSNHRAPYGFIGIFEPLHPHTKHPPKLARLTQKLTHLTTKNRSSHTPIPGTPEEPNPHTPPTYQLTGALWLGSNCVPLTIKKQHLQPIANHIARASRTIGSIFGNAPEVLSLWDLLHTRMNQPLSERPNQPLMLLDPTIDLNHLAQVPTNTSPHLPPITQPVRWARTSDQPSLLTASIAMFTEEIGYDPMTRDPQGYTQRVNDYIRAGRTLVATNTRGTVIFKVDIGLAHADICQLQGVWLHPAYRGQNLSAPLLAQACQLIRPRFPQISLYVNDYNHRALALYQRVGFQQIATYASILF